MPVEPNREVVRRFVSDVLNGRDLDALDELVAPECENHAAPAGARRGIDSWKRILGSVHTLGPERYTIEDIIAEGDKVALRLMRSGVHEREMRTALGIIPPTGKRYSIENVHIFRLDDGKIIEHWAVRDDLGLLRQLDALPQGEGHPSSSGRDQADGQ